MSLSCSKLLTGVPQQTFLQLFSGETTFESNDVYPNLLGLLFYTLYLLIAYH